MTNPFMSMWLAAAYRNVELIPNPVLADLCRQQIDMSRAWSEAWIALWMPCAGIPNMCRP